ncbi:Fur family transcriptional regulator [Aciditerrimonas ferrireducens]|uniref:Fur family transcriptional regulator n=1 Tax=Aciditerrimonas ferrireducens TaxID=667306 RepID=A0ABV6C6F9_9ACTN
MRTPGELVEAFRAQGRRVTAQRQCIFEVLQGDASHPTAEAVYERVRARIGTISLKTVYQTLHELVHLGEVAALDLGTGRVRFDPNVTRAHHHLVCRSCGEVRDLHAELADLPELPAEAAQGFVVGPAEVVFRGLCPACQGRNGRAEPRPDGAPHSETVDGQEHEQEEVPSWHS